MTTYSYPQVPETVSEDHRMTPTMRTIEPLLVCQGPNPYVRGHRPSQERGCLPPSGTHSNLNTRSTSPLQT
jgi:hypothetical protein